MIRCYMNRAFHVPKLPKEEPIPNTQIQDNESLGSVAFTPIHEIAARVFCASMVIGVRLTARAPPRERTIWVQSGDGHRCLFAARPTAAGDCGRWPSRSISTTAGAESCRRSCDDSPRTKRTLARWRLYAARLRLSNALASRPNRLRL